MGRRSARWSMAARPGSTSPKRDIQPWLDKRRPGASRFTTQRREADQVRILSGTFEGRTTGTPISLAHRQSRTSARRIIPTWPDAYRPGHADYTYDAKYGFRDWRGGGRSSRAGDRGASRGGRESRVSIIPDVEIRAYLVELGGDAIDRDVVRSPMRSKPIRFIAPTPLPQSAGSRKLD